MVPTIKHKNNKINKTKQKAAVPQKPKKNTIKKKNSLASVPRSLPPQQKDRLRWPSVMKSTTMASKSTMSVNGTVSAGTANSTLVGSHRAVHTATAHGEIVRHSEEIDDVTAKTEYSYKSYEINPGLARTFPYLSIIAKQYEQYRFKYLHFYYINRTGTNVKGAITISPEYNPENGDPASERKQASYVGTEQGGTWTDFGMKLSTFLMHSTGVRNFIRSLPVPGAIQLYDVARLYVATADFEEEQADQVQGKLWCDYEIEFFIPQVTSPHVGGPVAMTKAVIPGAPSSYTNIQNALVNIMDTSKVQFNGLELTHDGAGTWQVTIPGWYRLIYNFSGFIDDPLADALVDSYFLYVSKGVQQILQTSALRQTSSYTPSGLGPHFSANATAVHYFEAGDTFAFALWISSIPTTNADIANTMTGIEVELLTARTSAVIDHYTPPAEEEFKTPPVPSIFGTVNQEETQLRKQCDLKQTLIPLPSNYRRNFGHSKPPEPDHPRPGTPRPGGQPVLISAEEISTDEISKARAILANLRA
jgi:hypothetical protein